MRRRGCGALGVAAFGANHGAGPAAALARSPRCGGDGEPLAALPNVGLASMSGQRIVFPHATPEYFGEFAAQARALGARIIGGCCGTTPAQIAAIRAAVDDERAPAGSLLVRERESARPWRRHGEPTSSRGCSSDGEFVVSVQLDPPLGANPEALLATARAVRVSGKAQLVDVNDNPRARARMSGIMACVAIERFTGVETIPHLTPRDTTVNGLESVLLGAHAEGVRNILAVTGDPPEAGDYPGTHGVYEVDSIGLVELMAQLNRGRGLPRARDRRADVVLPGVAVNPTADDLELEVDRFHRKVAAGARFAMTQILFDLEPLEAFRERLGGAGRSRCSSACGRSARSSCSFACTTRRRAWSCRSTCRSGIAAPAPGAREVGGELGLELIAGARELAQGVYVVAPFRQPLNVVDFCPVASAAAQSPVETGACRRCERARTIDGGNAEAARRADARREDRRLDGAVPRRPRARPSCRGARCPATAVIERGTGPCPYASCVEDGRRVGRCGRGSR